MYIVTALCGLMCFQPLCVKYKFSRIAKLWQLGASAMLSSEIVSVLSMSRQRLKTSWQASPVSFQSLVEFLARLSIEVKPRSRVDPNERYRTPSCSNQSQSLQWELLFRRVKFVAGLCWSPSLSRTGIYRGERSNYIKFRLVSARLWNP